ncbi:Ribonucleases P/MRP protein subunit POP1 [Orchesella cincta]|uniref:Ribonucleases P/MRP protein subunit POP1 n=1 Tax=Orchesella cincta TaxID=48709 RepID=A0A1D2ND16_ORCCI|nr:Ribonucleases P/MRP protein subunit POP1 [Orchesella cincta]
MEDNRDALPSQIRVRQFIAARVCEIATLTTHIASAQDPRSQMGFSFQHVPKHMRRRAVSHNPKRLPTRLMDDHMRQVNKGTGSLVKNKKKSRFHRSRPETNVLEYNYRQLRTPNKPKWLESHVWHAKRFFMIPLWGMMLPRAPTTKAFKSLYVAAKRNAIMQDLSYLRCLVLTGGSKGHVLAGISKLITADYNISGVTSGELSSGREIVGVVTSSEVEPQKRYLGSIRYQLITPDLPEGKFKLILWHHPTLQSELIDELCSAYELKNDDAQVIGMEHDLNHDEKKFLWKLANAHCWSNEETGITMKDMSEFYNRIRLSGPKSVPILKEIFKIGNLPNAQLQSKSDQERIWNSLETIASMPNNSAIVLDVVDPRLQLPKVRKAVQAPDTMGEGRPVPPTSSMGSDSLWSEEALRNMLRMKIPDKEVSEKRRENLIPGTSIAEGMTPNVVSLGLVFRTDQAAGTTGVDIIVPVGWMMPVWIALSFCAVRPYGLEFNEYLTFETESFKGFTSSTYFPPDITHFPVSNASHHDEKKKKYFMYSPSKRENLIKLGCAFPFSVDWQRFLKFSFKLNEADVDVRVIRETQDLQKLAEYLLSKQKGKNISDLDVDDTQLVPVRLDLLNGCVSEGGCICLPTEKDLEIRRNANWKPTDHIHQEVLVDVNETKRQDLRNAHQKKLACLGKKRKKARRASRVVDESEKESFDSRINELDSKAEVEAYNTQMANLWIDDDVEKVLAKQTREVIGFVTYSHYSYRSGQFAAFGYITLRQLKKLTFLKQHMLVLVRDWSSALEYRWAKMSACIPM